MYYSYSCPYCSKLFYVFCESQDEAAKELFAGLQQHQVTYGENTKDPTLSEYDPEVETNMIYSAISGSEEIPSGGNPFE